MHFDHFAVDGGNGSIGGVPSGVGVQVNETEDEGVHEKRDALREAGSERGEKKTRLGLARACPHLNMIRMYVTWSIPVPFTYLVSSSVADMNNRPPATRNYVIRIRTYAPADRLW